MRRFCQKPVFHGTNARKNSAPAHHWHIEIIIIHNIAGKIHEQNGHCIGHQCNPQRIGVIRRNLDIDTRLPATTIRVPIAQNQGPSPHQLIHQPGHSLLGQVCALHNIRLRRAAIAQHMAKNLCLAVRGQPKALI